MTYSKSPTTTNLGWLLGAIALVLADQLSKIMVKGFSFVGIENHGMILGESIPILGEWVRLTYVENPGMAFGIEFGAGKIFLSLFSVAASAGLAWVLTRYSVPNKWALLALTLVLAGATGNLIDRVFYGVIWGEADLFYGRVVDFVDVEFPDFSIFGATYTRWPVFNIADACVSCGMVLMMLNSRDIPLIGDKQQADRPTLTEAQNHDTRD